MNDNSFVKACTHQLFEAWGRITVNFDLEDLRIRARNFLDLVCKFIKVLLDKLNGFPDWKPHLHSPDPPYLLLQNGQCKCILKFATNFCYRFLEPITQSTLNSDFKHLILENYNTRTMQYRRIFVNLSDDSIVFTTV